MALIHRLYLDGYPFASIPFETRYFDGKRSEIKVIEQAQSAVTMRAYHRQQQSLFSRVGYFILHFLEMCAVMCVSLAVFESIFVWAGSL
jgi:hypothetical protein